MVVRNDVCMEVTVVPCCPNCREKLQVSIAPCSKCPETPSPTALFASFFPTQVYLPPQSPLPSALTSPLPLHYQEEIKRLSDTVKALRLSGWYYGNLDWQGARTLLKESSPGAFIIRDSCDRRFIFSLSVQTGRGPTSVRLHYEGGYFRLDCESSFAKYMPRFRCVVDLVQHYACRAAVTASGTVWVDRDGCPHSPVLLKKPMRTSPPSLLHAARLAIHKKLDANPLTPKVRSAPKYKRLPLPTMLIDYLGEYPYSV